MSEPRTVADRAAYFDNWYAGMAGSAAHARIHQGALGLPPEVESTGCLPASGIDDVVSALAAGPSDVIVDAGCGRGGYGLEIARRTGASLIGIDFSAVALARASELATTSFSQVDAQFRTGALTSTGLPDGAAAGLVCIDAMQFADPYEAGFTECLRVLAPGGALVMTGWQAKDPGDEAVPRLLRLDPGATAASVGFVDVRSQQKDEWLVQERAMWEQAAAESPDDPAMQSMHDEGVQVLGWLDRVHRLLVTARRPGAHE